MYKSNLTLKRLEELKALADTLFKANNFETVKSISEDPFNGTIWQIFQLSHKLYYEESREQRLLEEESKGKEMNKKLLMAELNYKQAYAEYLTEYYREHYLVRGMPKDDKKSDEFINYQVKIDRDIDVLEWELKK